MLLSAIALNRANSPAYATSADLKGSGKYNAVLLHEIRNPLTNINLAIDALNFMITDEDPRMCLDIIKRGSRKINELITDLLVYSRVNDAESLQVCSLHQLLDEVLVMAYDRLLLRNITVTKTYDTQDYKKVLNRQMMKIAFTNIIINAIDAMSSENGQLQLSTRYNADKYIIEIADNGIGISEKNIKTIFEPYFTNKQGGMGLGLSATLEILLSNHVAIDVKSTEGKGTQFVLLFDLSANSANE